MNVLRPHRTPVTTNSQPPPTRDMSRASGTAMAKRRWLRRLVERIRHGLSHISPKIPIPGLVELSTIIAPLDNDVQPRK